VSLFDSCDKGKFRSTAIFDTATSQRMFLQSVGGVFTLLQEGRRWGIEKSIFQLGLFDQHPCEVQDDGIRNVLRRNPVRAQEMASTRASNLAALQALADEQNRYLAAHMRADQHSPRSENRNIIAWRALVSRVSA
jgi:hypothetical protein